MFWLDQFMDAAMTLTTFDLLLTNENIILCDPTASEKKEADRSVLENTLPAKVTQLLTILNPLPMTGTGSLTFPGSSRKTTSTPPTTEPQQLDNEQKPKELTATATRTQTGEPAMPAQVMESPTTDTKQRSPTVASADTVILHDENPKVCVLVNSEHSSISKNVWLFLVVESTRVNIQAGGSDNTEDMKMMGPTGEGILKVCLNSEYH